MVSRDGNNYNYNREKQPSQGKATYIEIRPLFCPLLPVGHALCLSLFLFLSQLPAFPFPLPCLFHWPHDPVIILIVCPWALFISTISIALSPRPQHCSSHHDLYDFDLDFVFVALLPPFAIEHNTFTTVNRHKTVSCSSAAL